MLTGVKRRKASTSSTQKCSDVPPGEASKGGSASPTIIKMWKTNQGSKITDWINICPFILKRCHYCIILIVFIDNTSEYAYCFKLGESHEGRQRLLVPPLTGWLSHWAVCHKLCWWALTVQLPLCQFCNCNLHVSYSVMFVYTFNMCTASTICSRIP